MPVKNAINGFGGMGRLTLAIIHGTKIESHRRSSLDPRELIL
jgi:hypothetical protein